MCMEAQSVGVCYMKFNSDSQSVVDCIENNKLDDVGI